MVLAGSAVECQVSSVRCCRSLVRHAARERECCVSVMTVTVYGEAGHGEAANEWSREGGGGGSGG